MPVKVKISYTPDEEANDFAEKLDVSEEGVHE